MPSVIPAGIAAAILGRAGRVAQRPCADPGSGGEVSRWRATLERGWQWTLRWRGGPRAGERAGGAELRWSSSAAQRKEGRKKEAPTCGPALSVKRARAGRALERLERVASWAYGRKRAGIGKEGWAAAGPERGEGNGPRGKNGLG